MNEMPSLGAWVRKQRRMLDLTQAELAVELSCALVTIKKIEQETRRPSPELAALLAARLQIPDEQRDAFLRMARGVYIEQLPVVPSPTMAAKQTPDTVPGTRPEYFVARERELAFLTGHLAGAINGSGRVVFITGAAGSGKTSLMVEFARQAQERYPDLISAGGNCDAFAGAGDPYLPFRDVMALLTGDVEVKWKAGLLSHEQARRLWALLPHTAQMLAEHGMNLIDVFVSGSALAQRAIIQAPEQTERWKELQAHWKAHQTASGGSAANMVQGQIFAQYTDVLRSLAQHRPLLLLLDDLQWTDNASAGLFFHLGRRLSDSRILILGAYRPDEVTPEHSRPKGDPTQEHLLIPIVQEFKRRYGDIDVDLSWLAPQKGKAFVDALLDHEPNRLSENFRHALFMHTEGHPLFTVEMLRDMQARGDLVQDGEGRWTEGREVDWQTLPARVEAVIGRRLASLPAGLQETLKIAAVEGETFTAEVPARIQAIGERQMVQSLSTIAGRQHRLVRSEGSRRVAERPISHYRFAHILFQKYLYDHLDDAERIYLHEAVGNVLETLYGPEVESIAVQLAYHFQAAGLHAKAITYLRLAGERSVRLSAHEEAIVHFTRALALLETLPETPERDEQEFHLYIALGVSVVTTKGWPAPETERVYARTYQLFRRLGNLAQIGPALSGLYYTYPAVYMVRGQLPRAREMGEQFLQLAQASTEPMLRVAAHSILGAVLYHMGELERGCAYSEQGSREYDLHRRRSHIYFHGPDLGVFCLSYVGHMRWMLGYPHQALQQGQAALAQAQEQAHLFSQVVAACYLSMLHQFRRDWRAVETQAHTALALCAKHDFAYYKGWATIMLGWARSEQGDPKAGIDQIEQGLNDLRAMRTGLRYTYYLALLAETHAKMGQVAQGLMLLDKALIWMEEHEERYYAAELHRLQGTLLLMQNAGAAIDAAEACFQTALHVARQQRAKSLELRALMSLCRLPYQAGHTQPAQQELADVYAWFAEGHDSVDMREAKAMLEQWTANKNTQ